VLGKKFSFLKISKITQIILMKNISLNKQDFIKITRVIFEIFGNFFLQF